MAARSKAWTCGPLAFWDCGFESHCGHFCLSVVSVVCCQVEVSATWSLVRRIPIEYGVSECDRETSLMRRPCPTRDCGSKKVNCPHLMGEINPKYTAVPYTKILRSGYT